MNTVLKSSALCVWCCHIGHGDAELWHLCVVVNNGILIVLVSCIARKKNWGQGWGRYKGLQHCNVGFIYGKSIFVAHTREAHAIMLLSL